MASNVRHSSGSEKWGSCDSFVEIARACFYGRVYVDPFTEEEFNGTIAAMRILDGTKGRDGFKDRWLANELAPRADHLLSGVFRPVAPVGFHVFDPRVVEERPFKSMLADDEAFDATAFVNAPGDESGEQIKDAYTILELYHRLGWLPGGAFWVGFTLNQFQTLQCVTENDVEARSPLSPAFEGCRCIPRKREAYRSHSTRPKTRINKHGVEVENDDAPSHPSFVLLMPSTDEIIAADQRRVFESMACKLGEVF